MNSNQGEHPESAENQNNIKKFTAYSDKKGETYINLKTQNPKIVGWINIPGTQIDYLVMWTLNYPEKCL